MQSELEQALSDLKLNQEIDNYYEKINKQRIIMPFEIYENNGEPVIVSKKEVGELFYKYNELMSFIESLADRISELRRKHGFKPSYNG